MTAVIEKRWQDRQWIATEKPGLDYSALRPHPSGGATFFLRFASGAVGGAHTHLYTPPDGVHDAVAHEETVLLLHTPKLPVFL